MQTFDIPIIYNSELFVITHTNWSDYKDNLSVLGPQVVHAVPERNLQADRLHHPLPSLLILHQCPAGKSNIKINVNADSTVYEGK